MANCVICKRSIHAANAGREGAKYTQRCPCCGNFTIDAPAVTILDAAVEQGRRTRQEVVDHFAKIIKAENQRSGRIAVVTDDDAQAFGFGNFPPSAMDPSKLRVSSDGRRIQVSDLLFNACRPVPAAIHQAAAKMGSTSITLDFSATPRAVSGPMLAVLAACARLHDESDVDFSLIRPRDDAPRQRFSKANWAHLLAPKQFAPSGWHPADVLPASRFRSPEEQREVVDRILDAVLSCITELTRSNLAGLEWAVDEITDNVLQHANSAQGGLAQLSHYPQRRALELVVADAGRGIPSSMRTTRPEISDPRALELSIQRGITRDKEVGQGNGLFGTHRASKVGTGDFVIHSGHASIRSNLRAREETVPVAGTLVVVTLDYSDPEALWRALDIHDTGADPAGDYIENRYEDDSDAVLHFVVRSEASSVGSRSSGRLVRAKVENLMAMYPNYPVNIDFGDISVVSSSFADEFIGKLFVRTGALRFMNTVRLRNVSPTVRAVLDRAILQRAGQASEG